MVTFFSNNNLVLYFNNRKNIAFDCLINIILKNDVEVFIQTADVISEGSPNFPLKMCNIYLK